MSRGRRSAAPAEAAAEDGPFVSFTDIFIGMLFLFLILVAALMVMHQEAVRQVRQEATRSAGISPQMVDDLRKQNQQMKAQLDEIGRKDAADPPFRLAIAYNEFQYENTAGLLAKVADAFTGSHDSDKQWQWIFIRTVRIYRSPDDLCLENDLLNAPNIKGVGNTLTEKDIPSADDQNAIRRVSQCVLTADGEHWKSEVTEKDMRRTSADLYEGKWVYHNGDEAESHDLQYRILRVYDSFYNQPSTAPEGSGH